jgi:hypothetical protein
MPLCSNRPVKAMKNTTCAKRRAVGVGVALGVAIGLALESVAVGIGLGVVLGIPLGIAGQKSDGD